MATDNVSSNGPRRPPVLVLALDAGDLKRIDTWTRDGTLPNLRRMRDEGLWAPLEGIDDFNSFSVWPSFATGAGASDHAYYSHMQLLPGSYELVATNSRTAMRVAPWWTRFADSTLRACLFDVPKIGTWPGVGGLQLSEWGAKSPADDPESDPPELLPSVLRRFGPHRGTLLDEDVAESPAYFRKLLQALTDSIRQRSEICIDLLKREPWDLFVHVFSETHSAGHRFMHFFEGDTSRTGERAQGQFRDALKSVYVEIDAAIGRIRAAAPPDAIVVSCSMHGMGPNENSEASELLPELLRHYSGIDRPASATADQPLQTLLVKVAHALTPGVVRDAAKHRLSQATRKRLRLARLRQRHDQGNWHRMKAFSLPSDEGAFVRINLEGREPRGIVARDGAEAVIGELTTIFEALRDPLTGTPAVRRVRRVSQEQAGAHTDALPDLVIEWTHQPLRALESPHLGTLGHFHAHRSGTHRPRGYLLACGPGIAAGQTRAGHHVLDIPPTLLALLGEPVQPQMAGRPIRIHGLPARTSSSRGRPRARGMTG